MQIESDPVSAIRPVGSSTNISMYLKLSTHSNIPVTVHTAWNGPNKLTTKNTATLIKRENDYCSVTYIHKHDYHCKFSTYSFWIVLLYSYCSVLIFKIF